MNDNFICTYITTPNNRSCWTRFSISLRAFTYPPFPRWDPETSSGWLWGDLLFLLSFWRSQFNTLYYRNRRYGNKHYDKVCRYEITENDRLRWVVYAMLPNNFSPNYRKIQCQITEYWKLLLSGKHVQGSIITDFLALQAPLERELTAVR